MEKCLFQLFSGPPRSGGFLACGGLQTSISYAILTLFRCSAVLQKATIEADHTGTIMGHSDKTCGNGTPVKLILPMGGRCSEEFGGEGSAEDRGTAANDPLDDGEHRGHDGAMQALHNVQPRRQPRPAKFWP